MDAYMFTCEGTGEKGMEEIICFDVKLFYYQFGDKGVPHHKQKLKLNQNFHDLPEAMCRSVMYTCEKGFSETESLEYSENIRKTNVLISNNRSSNIINSLPTHKNSCNIVQLILSSHYWEMGGFAPLLGSIMEGATKKVVTDAR